MADRILILPGLNGSGPGHWQSLWQRRHPEYERVEVPDWAVPDLGEWSWSLDRAIRARTGSVLLVAHSFGSLVALHLIGISGAGIAGALLVAPADPERFGLEDELPAHPLDVPTVVVASRNDPWFDFGKVRALAGALGSGFIDLGDAGHINEESGYGEWPEGEGLLQQISGGRSGGPGLARPVEPGLAALARL